MEHELPTSHKELLQAILMALVTQVDPDATFVEKAPEDVPEPAPPELGGRR